MGMQPSPGQRRPLIGPDNLHKGKSGSAGKQPQPSSSSSPPAKPSAATAAAAPGAASGTKAKPGGRQGAPPPPSPQAPDFTNPLLG